jgi:alkylation response protein AidB-like acyl-CoA dehydrogenase
VDFEFTPDQLELQDAVRTTLAGLCTPSLVRSVYEDGETGEGFWQQLVGLDWPGLAVPEKLGGVGLGFVELAIVVEELGRVVAPGPYLPTVTQYLPMVLEAGSSDQQATLVAEVLAGGTGALAIGEDGGSADLGAVAATATPSADGWLLHGTKRHVVGGATAERVAVVARAEGTTGEDGIGVFVVAGEALTRTARRVVDPTLPLADLVLDGVEVPSGLVLAVPGSTGAARAAARGVEVATAAMALSTVATCRAIFDATLAYAKVREQYDRVIGSFQALKHRLADMYTLVEKANALTYFAALTIAEEHERRTEAVSLAKAAASECQDLLVRDGLQLHGGIGYMWETDLHFSLKRAMAGDALFGTGAHHRSLLAGMLGLAPATAPTPEGAR